MGDLSGMLEPFSRRELRRKKEGGRREKEGRDRVSEKEKESVAMRGRRDDTAIVKVYQVEELEL